MNLSQEFAVGAPPTLGYVWPHCVPQFLQVLSGGPCIPAQACGSQGRPSAPTLTMVVPQGITVVWTALLRSLNILGCEMGTHLSLWGSKRWVWGGSLETVWHCLKHRNGMRVFPAVCQMGTLFCSSWRRYANPTSQTQSPRILSSSPMHSQGGADRGRLNRSKALNLC